MKESIDSLSGELVGKYVICRNSQSSGRRMFVMIPGGSQFCTLGGYHAMFTLSDRNLCFGYHVCQIKRFCQDKNGYPIMIVHSIKQLPDDIRMEDKGWEVLALYDGFADRFMCNPDETANLRSVYCRTGCSSMEEVFEKFVSGEFSVFDLYVMSKMPSPNELVCKAYLGTMLEDVDHPLLNEKIRKSEFSTVKDFTEFIDRRLDTSVKLGIDQSGSIFDIVERVEAHYLKLKLEEKAARREKRRARKAS